MGSLERLGTIRVGGEHQVKLPQSVGYRIRTSHLGIERMTLPRCHQPTLWQSQRSFILFGAARFERLLINERVIAFLAGATLAAVGAISGSAIRSPPLSARRGRAAVLAAAAVALRFGVVATLLAAGMAGAVAGLLGAPLLH